MKIGVFDSGIGGEAVANALRLEFPDTQIDTINDRDNLPYGDKDPDQVYGLTHTALQPFLNEAYDVIILACNTATACSIEKLRLAYPLQKFIGIEPMVKTAAALTKMNTIIVCATPATLASSRYNKLVDRYACDITIIEPDCSQWASMIENNLLNTKHIEETLLAHLDKGADVIVLGCTHYHWIKDLIIDISGDRAQVIEPSEAIGRRVRAILT